MAISSIKTQELLDSEDLISMINDLDDIILESGLDGVLEYISTGMINPREALVLGYCCFKKINDLSG